MAVKAETIEQFGGFGNLVPKSPSEHYRSSGFTVSRNGMVAGQRTYQWFAGNGASVYTQYPAIGTVMAMAEGLGRDTGSSGGSDPFLFALDSDGTIYGSEQGTTTPVPLIPVERNSSHFLHTKGGLIVDQKNRLLYPGDRYLGMFDPAVDEGVGSATYTNGSDVVNSGTGDAFVAGDVGKFLRVFDGGTIMYYRIKTYTSGTAVVLYSNFTGTTGTKSHYILRSWTDQWKDFGAGGIGFTSEGEDSAIATETYEDTVLFGRNNKITTLNTLTDTITTDASPAFTLPDGFDILNIHKGSNGVLIASNFQRKGVLVLWDNFSDRSIAPWIQLEDRIVSCCKYNGGWIVITSREIFYTNGYSLTPLINSFLDSRSTVFTASLYSQTSLVIENDLYCNLGVSYNGMRKNGLYKINIDTKLAEHVIRHDMEQHTLKNITLFYGAGNGTGRVYVGGVSSWDYVVRDLEPTVSTFITNPVGRGDNWKHAEAVKVNLGVSDTYYSKDSPFSFTAVLRVAPLRSQMLNSGQLKTAMVTNYDRITVDETVYYNAQIGETVEFFGGANRGYSRNIISKTGAGTNTAVWIFDRALPNLDTDLTSVFFVSPFELVNVKTYTNVTEMPEIWFDIKNKTKGKKFMIRLDIENATLPVELRPMLFVYDDLGIL